MLLFIYLFILHQNQYQINKPIEQKLNTKTKHNHKKENTHKQNIWLTLTYFGHGTQQIAKIFKDTENKVAFRTTNTMEKHLQPKQ
jgi:SOS response regulatory protein OraA/RecX